MISYNILTYRAQVERYEDRLEELKEVVEVYNKAVQDYGVEEAKLFELEKLWISEDEERIASGQQTNPYGRFDTEIGGLTYVPINI